MADAGGTAAGGEGAGGEGAGGTAAEGAEGAGGREASGGGDRPATGSNSAWFARAARTIPGGVDSPVRSFASVGGTPFTVAHGEGPWVFDVEGNRYLDLVQSYGAVLLGHGHPVVVEAVCRAATLGSSFGMPTPGEVLLAEAICARVPGCEQVRFVSSGTEAAMSALRLARGVTGRSRVVTFAGCYHGHSDGLLAAGGSGVATLGLPGSAGVPAAAVADTVVAPYNVVPELDERVACVIVEPVAANMGVISPAAEFLKDLGDLVHRYGALLICDEVISGFRLRYGTVHELFSADPDLVMLGKVIGGGLPIGAVAGREELMDMLAPAGPVYQAGTLSGSPVAVRAGIETLKILARAGTYERLEATSTRLSDGMAEALRNSGLKGCINRVGSLVTLFLGVEAVRDAEEARRADTALFARFFHAMLERGIYLPPSQFEAMFVSLAHSDADIDDTITAARESLAHVARS